MATKQEWIDYLEQVETYAKQLKDYIKDLPDDGDVVAQDGPGSNPPSPPPPPPGS